MKAIAISSRLGVRRSGFATCGHQEKGSFASAGARSRSERRSCPTTRSRRSCVPISNAGRPRSACSSAASVPSRLRTSCAVSAPTILSSESSRPPRRPLSPGNPSFSLEPAGCLGVGLTKVDDWSPLRGGSRLQRPSCRRRSSARRSRSRVCSAVRRAAAARSRASSARRAAARCSSRA